MSGESGGDRHGLVGRRLGRYVVDGVLGEGGMGVVLAARDEALDRPVAIKTLADAGSDAPSRERLRREARVLASINHPNVCQVFAIEEDGGELFLVMERLEGEPLSARLARGPMSPEDGVEVTLGMLAALEALHARGIVHRDLKPSNAFLTAHGVKILDFGLARPHDVSRDPSRTTDGLLVGTPRYLAPEQWLGEPATPAGDQFAAGAMLFEMLSGRPAFPGQHIAEVAHRVLEESPPALSGTLGVAAIDRIIGRALAKRPQQRHPDIASMAAELRAARAQLLGAGGPVEIRAVTRLIVLPFRMLRLDPDIEFLSYSIPDAITTTLAGLDSIVMRSSATAARWGTGEPDLERVAVEADVDAVLLGTLLRAGDQVRLGAQLVQAPSGTVLCSASTQAPLDDIFQLQDSLTRQVVDALALPLSTRERRQLGHDVPANARAYEFYLRANEVGRTYPGLETARELYRTCLDADPNFAPAWARIGRVYRVMAKYGMVPGDEAATLNRNAAEAFERALALSPDLSLAHNLYTPFELEQEGKPLAALQRLLDRAATRSADPELFAGLVLACRYCGLMDASLAAHARAKRLDPTVPTSVTYTHLLRGDPEAAAAAPDADPFVPVYVLFSQRRLDEARQACEEAERRLGAAAGREVMRGLRAALVGDAAAVVAALDRLRATGFCDPEGLFFEARALAWLGENARAVALVEDITRRGFACPHPFRDDPFLAGLQSDPAFARAVATMQERSAEAARLYESVGGEAVLGASAS